MNEQTFIHETRSGPWTCTIYLLKSNEGDFSAVGDIAFRGRHRCKLVLCRPDISTKAGIAILKQQCISWIEQTEQAGKPTPPASPEQIRKSSPTDQP